MVTEIALLEVTPGAEDAFVEAYRQVRHEVAETEGCRTMRMTRGVESPGRFVLVVARGGWLGVVVGQWFGAPLPISGPPARAAGGGPTGSVRTSPGHRRWSTTSTSTDSRGLLASAP